MADSSLILGEYTRTLDERNRLSLPQPLIELLDLAAGDCVLAKERAGSISLWSAKNWSHKLEQGVDLVRNKIEAGRLDGRLAEVQMLGRLLSTRHRQVQLGGKGRLLVPDGFREFLGVAPGGEILIVGAAVCVELWKPDVWIQYVEEHMSEFRHLFDSLSA